jgi:hypothetical protein
MIRDLGPPFSFDIVAGSLFLAAWFELGVYMDI